VKNLFLAAVFAVIAPGAAYAGGSALDDLKSDSRLAAGDISFTVPKAPAGVPAAAAGLKAETGATAFQTLKDLFAKGRPATESELTGWYSGRRVLSYQPNVIYGSLLAGEKSGVHPGGGPLFQESAFKLISTIHSSPDFYDKMVPSAVNNARETVRQGVKWVPSFTVGATAATRYLDGNECRYQYRKTGDYIVERWVSYGQDWTITGETYSYYFVNVTPR
jgi:hypothetical protein